MALGLQIPADDSDGITGYTAARISNPAPHAACGAHFHEISEPNHVSLLRLKSDLGYTHRERSGCSFFEPERRIVSLTVVMNSTLLGKPAVRYPARQLAQPDESDKNA